MSGKEENKTNSNDDIKDIDLRLEKKNELKSQVEENGSKSEKFTVEEINLQLEKTKKNLVSCEEKLKHSLADFQNLQRKTNSDIEFAVNLKIDKFMVNFLDIYDDFVRAKTVLANENLNVEGLNSILKNMNSLLTTYDVKSINALGEIFDPNFHEAISFIEDSTLDDSTVTKEIRKGYISNNRVIRPTIVEISKKPESNESKKDNEND